MKRKLYLCDKLARIDRSLIARKLSGIFPSPCKDVYEAKSINIFIATFCLFKYTCFLKTLTKRECTEKWKQNGILADTYPNVRFLRALGIISRPNSVWLYWETLLITYPFANIIESTFTEFIWWNRDKMYVNSHERPSLMHELMRE